MEATTDLFINIIRNHRIIYDTKSKDFKNVHKKEDEWVFIANESRMNVEAAKKRYASLRQKYAREKKKEIICSRTKQIFRPSVFFDRLSFLNDFVKPRRTYTNDVEGMDLIENDTYDDPDDQVLDTPYSGFFTDGYYSLDQEQADAEEALALAELEREGLLPVENEIEILEDVEVGSISRFAGDEQVILNLNENEDELLALQTQPNGAGSSTQSESLNNIRPPIYLLKSSETRQQNGSLSASHSTINTQPSSSVSHSDHNYLRVNAPNSQGLGVRDRSIEPQSDGSSNFNDTRDEEVTLTTNRGQSTGRVTSSLLAAFHEKNRPSPNDVNRATEAQNMMSAHAQPALTVNRNQSTGKVTSSILSKNSPIVQAVSASHEKGRPSGKGVNNTASMDAIKARMEAYLTACNEKLQKKSDRSPHARFLCYLGTKMENVPKEKVEMLEQELLGVVFRYSGQN